MTFSPEQLENLRAPLDAKNVKSRTQAGRNLSYVEGWHIIAEANRIFGHDAWDRATELALLGQPEQKDNKWRARYMAVVTITVRAGEQTVRRQGVGYGSGIAVDLGDAFEGAIKEAETDATKRALMTFGWPFGLALYDKGQEHVTNGDTKPDPQSNGAAPDETQRKAKGLIDTIRACQSIDDLDSLKAQPEFKSAYAALPTDLKDAVKSEGASQKVALDQAEALSA